MKISSFLAGLGLAASIAAAPLSAQTSSQIPMPEPAIEHASAPSELRGRTLLFSIVGVAVILGLLLLTLDGDGGAEPQPGPPITP